MGRRLSSNYAMKVIGLILLVALGMAQQVFAKAAFYGPEWMVAHAECVAIVNITRVQTNSAGVQGQSWTYRETAQATVERVLKGQLPQEVTLYGGENFICAQVHYRPGRHLVFLKRDAQLLTVINWHLGNRPIAGERIEWFSEPGKNVFKLAATPLDAVIAEIRGQLARERE